jgi:Zn-dependent protease
MQNSSRQEPLQGRLAWTLLGLILAWNVAQGSLLEFAAVAAPERAANATYLAGVALSLAAHEFVQWLVARSAARRPRRAELAAAAAGPPACFLLSFAVLVAARVAYVAGLADPLIRALAAVAAFNIVLGAVNLLPALPLDGGRLLRAALPARAGRAVAATSEALALLMLAGGFASAFVAGLADAFSWILAGVILFAEGRAARAGEAEPGLRGGLAEHPPAAAETAMRRKIMLRRRHVRRPG